MSRRQRHANDEQRLDEMSAVKHLCKWGNVSGDVYVPQGPENFSYDPDGNLTNDGRWSYVWDAENRLIQMSVNTSVGPQYRLNFAYDYKGRRIQKAVTMNGSGVYTNNFLYDGWNLVGVLSPQSTVLQSFVWGSDLSGSQQGAGGVGGLLEVINYGVATNFVAYDGNGNVATLVNAADGSPSANYEYGPFGEPIRMTGLQAKANPFRFSTKYDDDESDLLYYGYRYCKPATGTWVSRDPIGEIGHKLNRTGRSERFLGKSRTFATTETPYTFLKNDSIIDADFLGLCGGSDAPCKCGEDVTLDVMATLNAIGDAYATASTTEQGKAKFYMFGPPSLYSWDMTWLKDYTSPNWNLNGCSQCYLTVTFGGRCVAQDELNYMMYGYAIELTDTPYQAAIAELEAGLKHRPHHDAPDVVRRKVGFAKYAYDGYPNIYTTFYPSIPADLAWPYPCQAQVNSFPKKQVNIEDWRWPPLNPISQ